MNYIFDLQLFSEGNPTEPIPGNPIPGKDPEGSPEPKGDPEPAPAEPELKYSDEDLDRILNSRFARWENEKQKAVTEAAKLAKMNADQKQQYELERLQKENEELKQAAVRIELGKTATALLRENNMEATEGVLSFVVGEDAEQTKKNIDAFVKLVEAQVQKAETARATGTTPRVIGHSGNAMSEIDKRLAKYK